MTTATRLPKSWAVPKIDTKDASVVVYLPLWHPYSDMKGSTIYSYDSNRHTGTVTGTLQRGQGFTFDGIDDRINIADSAALDTITSSFSLVAWINESTVTVQQHVLGKGGAYSRDGYAVVIRADASVRFIIGTGAAGETLTDNGSLSAETWYHIVATFDGTTMRTYIDGVLQATTGTPATVGIENNFPFRVGCSDNDNLLPFDGTIGEVMAYNRALTIGEIQRLRQVTYWRYN